MSSKKDTSDKKRGGPNRRSVIATAAVAAGAALPLVAVTDAKAQGRGTRIAVDLGGVSLPEAIAAKLEQDIRRAVLIAVAAGAPKTKFSNGPLGPGIRGIIMIPQGLSSGGMQHM